MYRVEGGVGRSASTLAVLIPERIIDIRNHQCRRDKGSANHICISTKSSESFPI